VQDGVHIVRVDIGKQQAGISCGKGLDDDPPPLCFLSHVGGDGELALGARADDETLAAPRDLLCGEEGRVPTPALQGLRGALVPLTDLSAIDHYVAAVAFALDLELSERDQLSLHDCILPPHWRSAMWRAGRQRQSGPRPTSGSTRKTGNPAAPAVLLIDEGEFYFELRGVRVRGTFHEAGDGTRELVPEKITTWDYGSMRKRAS
jgi:hypothetical protein